MATVFGTLLLCLLSKYQRSVPYFFNKKLGFEPILMFHSKICKEYIFFIAIRYCNFLAKKSILEYDNTFIRYLSRCLRHMRGEK